MGGRIFGERYERGASGSKRTRISLKSEKTQESSPSLDFRDVCSTESPSILKIALREVEFQSLPAENRREASGQPYGLGRGRRGGRGRNIHEWSVAFTTERVVGTVLYEIAEFASDDFSTLHGRETKRLGKSRGG
jgi:hypothetical protein